MREATFARCNIFYARFNLINKDSVFKSTPPPEDQPLSISLTLEAAGPDNIPVLRTCANQLVDVSTDIFNISVSQESVPTCFKTATIIPVPHCNSVLDFLTNRHSSDWQSHLLHCGSQRRSPPGLCAYPLLFTLHTHDFKPNRENSVVKFADDTTFIGWI